MEITALIYYSYIVICGFLFGYGMACKERDKIKKDEEFWEKMRKGKID